MKRILTLFCVAASFFASAQTPFLTPVSYRGAFAPAPTTMWTGSWVNWDPQSTIYTGVDSSIITPITSDLTLSGSKKYRLKGTIFVKNGATLTIQAGCIIKGDSTVANTALVITRGSKIVAKGTSTKPIVFTSSQNPGSRGKGDWGGVILLGNAHYNGATGTNYIEGITQSEDTKYGGGLTPNDDDSSGVMQYCRIEYGGYIFAPNQEINGLTFGAVGRKTVIDHIQVSYSNDDAFEWFGGSVNCKYLVSYRNLDDNWDTDNGFNGAVQFCLGIRDPNIADNPAVSTSEGFESDNDAAGSSNRPYTSAIFANVTDIGPLRGNTAASIATGFRRSVRIRRNSHLRIVNSILMDFPTGVFIDGAACAALANGTFLATAPNNPNNLVFKNNLLAGNQTGKVMDATPLANPQAWFAANKNDSLVPTTGILVNPYDFLAGDYRPAVGSAALKNANWNDSAFYAIDTVGTLRNLIACPATVATPATIIGSTNACTYIASGNTAKYYLSAKSILGVLRNEWIVPAGVTIVSGQYTDTLVVTYSNSFTGGNISAKNLSYCGTYSALKSLAIQKGVPSTPGTISGPAFVCSYVTSGDTATYSIANVLYATSYNWVAPANATIVEGQGTKTVKVTFSGAFTKGNLTVQALAVCGNSAFKSLALSKTTAAPGTISGKTATCGFTGTPLTYSIAPVANATSYIWTVPAGAAINGANDGTSISVTYSSVVSGTVTVKSVTGCGQSAAKSLSIVKVATPGKINGAAKVCAFDEQTYTAFDTVNNASNVTYTWTAPAGISIVSGQGTGTLVVSVDGSFISGNLAVKAVGCATAGSSRTLTLSLDPACPSLARQQTLKVTNDNDSKLSVTPNPNRGTFTVRFNSKVAAEKGTIQILNSFGQLVSQRVVAANSGYIYEQVSNLTLAPGVYMVKCTVGTDTQITKVIVQ